MDVCRHPARLPVTGTFQKENEMPVSEGSQEFCPATAFSHGSNLDLKRTAIPLVLLYFYHSCDQGSFLLMNICLKYQLCQTA